MNALVTPKVLSWARNSAGYPVEDIVGKLNARTVTKEVVLDWERGNQQPTYAQLENLANIYNRPIAVFFFPEPPAEDSAQQQLRALPEEYAQSLLPSIRYLVRKAQAMQINLAEIYGSVLPKDFQNFKREFSGISLNDAKALATRVRQAIGVDWQEQFDWKDSGDALKKWRNKLEDKGIWIFKDSFKADDYAGFCLYHKSLPVVYINNSESKNRQIFTLFHELGHLLIAKGGVDFRNNVERKFTGGYRQEEVFCNAFAGQFLVPSNSINISNDPDDEQIYNYAKQYKVSREVILRKYLDKKIITNDFYLKKVENWHLEWLQKEQEKDRKIELDKKTGGPNYYVTQKSYLGDKYLALTFRQYYKGGIDEAQLSDYLGVKVKSLRGLESYVLENR